jgi:hypothetical protein
MHRESLGDEQNITAKQPGAPSCSHTAHIVVVTIITTLLLTDVMLGSWGEEWITGPQSW